MEDKKIFKSGFTAIIGRPNVGKSTLMNALIGQKIAITSGRAQTTRRRIETVYTDDRGQIVFVDTPGINKAKTKLGDYMLESAEGSLRAVDCIMWLVEPSTFIGAGERAIIEMLSRCHVPVILVINKIDAVKPEEVPKAIDKYKSELPFADIVPVSAIKNKNTDELLDIIFSHLHEGHMYYDEDTVTEETVRDIASELIREQALKLLDKEVPHGIAVLIDSMKEREGQDITDIEATIICERDSHKGIIIGKNGAMLKKIGSRARAEIEDMLEQKVNLKIWVKVRPGWRDNNMLLREYGYDKKDLR